ncbi:MAG: hypothetical protein HBSAPP03_19820 [Phycisphaerae bacterium]|nr:MAG: hypothetical protein HBSAPP03_19820 [Phycisphaerae bacterium]
MSNRHREVTGFTLVETLVVALVVSVLMGLVIAAVAASRTRSAQASCAARCRGLGTLVATYAADYRDALPAYHADSPAALLTRAQQVRYNNQSAFMFASGMWQNYSGIDRFSNTGLCPRVQAAFLETRKPEGPWRTDYEIVRCAYLDPARLDPDGPFEMPNPAAGARLQRLSDVRFPSMKVGVVEQRVWHAWRGSWTTETDVSALVLGGTIGPSSVWYFDGHGGLVRPREFNAGVAREWWGSGAFHMTPWGLHGRDEPI